MMGSDDGEVRQKRHRLNKQWAALLALASLIILLYNEYLQFGPNIDTDVSRKREKVISYGILHPDYFETVQDFAKHKARGNSVILTFVSFSYRLNAINWAVHMEKLKINNYAFVCLDEDIFLFFNKRHILCYRLYADPSYDFYYENDMNSEPNIENIRSLWVVRLKLLRDILNAGIDVIYSDVDAVWLKNPLPIQGEGLLSPHMGDIVSSRGSFPVQVSKFWGTTLCMGLIYFRSTEAVVSLIEKASIKSRIYRDDQIAINLALLEEMFDTSVNVRNVSQDETLDLSKKQVKTALEQEINSLQSRPIEFALMKENGAGFDRTNKLDYIQDTQIAVADINNVRIALLPHNLVPRCCGKLSIKKFRDTVAVAHCHVSECLPAKTLRENWGKAEKRILIMNKYYSWCLSLKDQKFNVNGVKALTNYVDDLYGRDFQQWFHRVLKQCINS